MPWQRDPLSFPLPPFLSLSLFLSLPFSPSLTLSLILDPILFLPCLSPGALGRKFGPRYFVQTLARPKEPAPGQDGRLGPAHLLANPAVCRRMRMKSAPGDEGGAKFSGRGLKRRNCLFRNIYRETGNRGGSRNLCETRYDNFSTRAHP